jgi:ribosomal protein S18 acetylase RimI-like enzyme
MASRLHFADLRPPDLVDLRTLNARSLEPLLVEEIAAWRDELEWQFDQSASLVRRFVDLRALHGGALLDHGQPTGYLYYVVEENKALIGDLYLRRSYRTQERENLLLHSAVEEIAKNHQITRIESQLLMLAHSADRPLPLSPFVTVYDRNFMRAALATADLREGRMPQQVRIERWNDQNHEAAAHLIAAAYADHIDSRINDQYRSVMGARRFLFNIVQFPGCGVFFRPASFTATDPATGRIVGISLSSLVAPESGHITQICVAPEMHGQGLGHELLRRSLETFKEAGCVSASLTVTSENRNAVALYERVGFETVRRFSAYAWEGF